MQSLSNPEILTAVIGWASSVILLLTISKQIHKQWRDRTSEGVSKWLFIGQLTASVGFTIYSWLIHSKVFVATNALMALSALLGWSIVYYHRRRHAGSADSPGEHQ